MSFDPNKPVTLEEYNATLRDSVNAYYVHAMNDPAMSKEEAINSTAEMSENYLGAVQEFQEAQEAQSGPNAGMQAGESAGVQEDNTASVETGTVDAGPSEDSVSEDNGINNDGGDLDDGMDI